MDVRPCISCAELLPLTSTSFCLCLLVKHFPARIAVSPFIFSFFFPLFFFFLSPLFCVCCLCVLNIFPSNGGIQGAELAADEGKSASALAACRTLAEELTESRFPAPRILAFKVCHFFLSHSLFVCVICFICST